MDHGAALPNSADEKSEILGLESLVVEWAERQLKQVLPPEGAQIDQLWEDLEKLASIGKTSQSLLVHCLGEYISSVLSEEHVAELGQHLKSQIDEYLNELLKFKHSYSIHLSQNPNQARLQALRTAIHYKYPLLRSEGAACISRPPVFYGTTQYPLFKDSQQNSYERSKFSWELLQDQSSFNQIPARVNDDQDPNRALPPLTIDIQTLEEEIERDAAKGRLPCAVLASHLDDLVKIRQLCDKHRLWLHVEGGSSSLLLAAGNNQPVCTKTLLDCANSISAQPLDWWKDDDPNNRISSTQVRSTCTLTFLRIDRQYEAPQFPVAVSDFSLLFSLCHQFSLQDTKQMAGRVDHSLSICDHLKRQLESHNDLFSVTIGPDPVLLPHVLLFQITPNSDHVDLSYLNLDGNAFHLILQDQIDTSLVNDLALTSTRYQGVTCFMFQPLKIRNVDTSISVENINQFVESICEQIRLLESAVQARSMFEELLSLHPDLEPVPYQEVQSFVGIGAFRFVPEVLSNQKAISSLNQALAMDLEKRNSIYTLSRSEDGMSCIAITISEKLSAPEFVTDLVDEIRVATEHLTFPQDVLDNMSLAIKEGISTAEEKIQEHNAEAYRPDTLIRKIPVFGSMYGWMFPTGEKEADLGHTYDIRVGRLSEAQIEVLHEELDVLNTQKTLDDMKTVPLESETLDQVSDGVGVLSAGDGVSSAGSDESAGQEKMDDGVLREVPLDINAEENIHNELRDVD